MCCHVQSSDQPAVSQVSPSVSQLLAVVQHSPKQNNQPALPDVPSFVHRLLPFLASAVAASDSSYPLFCDANEPQGSLCGVAYGNHLAASACVG
jgi:hypothetical protein